MSEVPLEKYLESRLANVEDKLALHVQYAKEAVDLARKIIDKRMEEGNFVRDQLREQAATLVSKDSFDLTIRAAAERVDRLMDRVIVMERESSNMQGRFWALGVVFAVISVVIQVAARYLFAK